MGADSDCGGEHEHQKSFNGNSESCGKTEEYENVGLRRARAKKAQKTMK